MLNSTSLGKEAPEAKVFETCVPVLHVASLRRDLDDTCRMTSSMHWQGAAVWRWTLFILIFWPVNIVGLWIARFQVAVGMVMISFNVWQGSVRSPVSCLLMNFGQALDMQYLNTPELGISAAVRSSMGQQSMIVLNLPGSNSHSNEKQESWPQKLSQL
jgi:hypothetical protein